MNRLIVRAEKSTDAPTIRLLNELAFSQSDEADLVDQLRDSVTEALSLVAEDDGTVVGHILFTPAAIEHASGSVVGMALAPMAVHPDWQRQGVGSLLVTQGVEYLRERQCPYIVVVGHADYYPRFGFERGSLHEVSCQWDSVPDDAFMILVLHPDQMVGVTGTARYQKQFDSTT
jgi:putative acetyltransferase